MKGRIVLFALLVAVLVGVAPVRSAQMTLEAQPTVSAAEDLCDIFYVCSMWHEVYPVWCTDWHVIYCGPIETLTATPARGFNNEIEKKFVGGQLILDNRSGSRKVQIDGVAPQYHLASGAIVEPIGPWSSRDANGEVWRDVRKFDKAGLTVASWDDKNRDGIVGVNDQVVFDNGTASTIKTVRLGVHVSVLSETPRN